MPTYRCETCGTTETSSAESLDQFWIAVPPVTRAPDPGIPLRYCGTGCLPASITAAPPTSLAGTLQPLSQWFESHATSHRVIALLSPT